MRPEPHEPKLRSRCGSRAALLLAVLLASGCGGVQNSSVVSPVSPFRLDSLTFTVKAGANANRPVRVALVQTQDTRLLAKLMRIESTAWFGVAGDAFRRTYPQAVADEWELVPGLVAGPFEVAVDALVAGVLFCETRAGSPPLPVKREGDVTVEVGDGGCTLGGGLPQQEGQPVRQGIPSLFGWFD